MTPNETEAFAALRMQVAQLHTALKAARADLISPDAGPLNLPTIHAIDEALEQSEPELRALVLAIDQDEGALSKLRSHALSAAASGVRSHHQDVERTRAAGEEAVAHANSQLQAQSRAFSALAVAARAVLAERTKFPDPPPMELAPLCKAIDALSATVPG